MISTRDHSVRIVEYPYRPLLSGPIWGWRFICTCGVNSQLHNDKLSAQQAASEHYLSAKGGQ